MAAALPEADPDDAPADVDLRKADESTQGGDAGVEQRKLGTFGGVFTPTLLTIFGVILFRGLLPGILLVESATELQGRFEVLTSIARPNGTIRIMGGEMPQADVSIFGLSAEPDLELIESMVARTGSSCLFVRDSGQESALA